ncbi:MAG: hypothetical protein KDB27_35245 [Planctomycetales bacterium]|nr:hypothetical protein [Planctomycetales bacterium]
MKKKRLVTSTNHPFPPETATMNRNGYTCQFGLKALLSWVMVAAAICVTAVEASQRGYTKDWTLPCFFLLLSAHTLASLFTVGFSRKLAFARYVADRPTPPTSQTSKKSKLLSGVFVVVAIALMPILAELVITGLRFVVGQLVSVTTPVPFFIALYIAAISSKRLSYDKGGSLLFFAYGRHSWLRQIYLACVGIAIVTTLALGSGPKIATLGVITSLFAWDAMVPELQIYEQAIVIRGRSCLPKHNVTEFRWNNLIPGELVVVTADGYRTSFSARAYDKPNLSRLMHSYLDTPTAA